MKTTIATANQKGATLLELTMAVGIIAVIAIAAISFFQGASESTKSQEIIRNVGALTATVRNQYQGQGNYTDLDNDAVKTSNGFPTSMNPDVPGAPTSDISHPWNNSGVTVTFTTFISPDDGIQIELVDVPQAACIDIASKTYRDYEEVLVNGGVIDSVGAALAGCADPASNPVTFRTR